MLFFANIESDCIVQNQKMIVSNEFTKYASIWQNAYLETTIKKISLQSNTTVAQIFIE